MMAPYRNSVSFVALLSSTVAAVYSSSSCSIADGDGQTCPEKKRLTDTILLQHAQRTKRHFVQVSMGSDEICYDQLPALASHEGGGVGYVATTSATECKQACSGNSLCQSMSFCPQWNGCWLKDLAFVGDESGKKMGECTTYYKVPCTVAPVTQPPQERPCYGYLTALASNEGGEVGYIQTSDIEDCKQGCDGNSLCQSVSFCPQWKGCWMKDKFFTGGESTRKLGECKTYYKMSCEGGHKTTTTATTTTTCFGSACDGACCGSCGGGSPFCSPISGSCYESKAKDYYLSCSTTTTTPWSGIPTCTTSGACPIKVISLNLADGQGVSSRAIAPTVGGQMPFDLGGFQEPRGWSEDLDFKDSDTLEWYQSDTKHWPETNPAPIAWNKNRFLALHRGSHAEVARDGCGARVLEFVNLIDKFSGKQVFFANTHGPVSSVCGWGSSSWEYDKNMAEVINKNKGESEVVIVVGDFNTGPHNLQQTRAIAFNKIEGSWNIDMILSNVPCSGGSFDGGRSDHDGVEATCDFFQQVETCCDDCAGKPFCSPISGGCYDSQRKDYYLTCEVSTQS